MNKQLLRFTFFLLICFTLPSAATAQVVSIPDANLRAAVANALGKAAGAPITVGEMATLTQLEARNTNISDLTGLEHAHNLERLDFSGDWVSGTGLANSNEVSNVSLLSGLTQLTSLDLGGNNISDISPLAELTNLTSLYLYDNSVSDISAMADLTKLTLLHLWGNNVSDISPVADLTNLTSLFLGGNSVSDISAVADLTKLTQLGLGGNNILDISPVVDLTNLTLLFLGGNNISDISPVADLTNLTRLDLGYNNISDISVLSGLTNLTELYLGGNSILDISPLVANTGFGHGDTVDVRSNPLNSASVQTYIPALKSRGVTVRFEDTTHGEVRQPMVDIPDANLRAAIENVLDKVVGAPISVGEMATLTQLVARNANISDLTGLEHAHNLKQLDLSSVWVRDEGYVNSNAVSNFSPILGLTHLTYLNLGYNNITDISALASLTNLTELYLADNNITDISAVAQLTNLTRLYLAGNNITDISAVARLTNLTELYLGGNNITNISAVASLTNLTELYLGGNNITNISTVAGLTNLTRLHLQNNSLSDISALMGLTNLTWLYLQNNSLLDISAVAGLTNLTRLYLEHNSVSDISAVAGLTKLTELNLWDNNVSDISPLVANVGLGSGDTINVQNNPLSYLSLPIHTHIPTLQSRGVSVGFYDWTHFNVGEPRTVRLIYFLPKDQQYRANVVQQMKEEILNIQTFYAEQMEAHGYGKRTFRIETDPRGEPTVHRVDGEHPQSHYHDNTASTVPGEISQAFDLRANVYLILADHMPGIGQGGGRRVGGVGGPTGKNGGYALVSHVTFRTMAHELGHAFGEQHDFRDGVYIMSYGASGVSRTQLSPCHAERLSVHPHFNSDIPTKQGKGPTIELISPHTYPAGSQSVPVRFKISDSDGLHQAFLYVPTREGHAAAGAGEVKLCHGLEGETDTVVEFDYDGVIPSNRFTSLSDTVAHPITIYVVDAAGNAAARSFTLVESSPYHIVSFSGHRHTVNSVSFSPDGAILASGAQDGAIKLWDITTRKGFATLYEDRGVVNSVRSPVNSVSFSPDGTILASGADDGTVRLWDITTRESFATLSGHRGPVNSVSFSPDGTTLASGSEDGAIKLWNVTNANKYHHL